MRLGLIIWAAMLAVCAPAVAVPVTGKPPAAAQNVVPVKKKSNRPMYCFQFQLHFDSPIPFNFSFNFSI